MREFLAREILAISQDLRGFVQNSNESSNFRNNMSEFLEVAKIMFVCSKLGTYENVEQIVLYRSFMTALEYSCNTREWRSEGWELAN